MSPYDQVKLASGLNIVAAVWLFISAFAVPMNLELAWSNALVAVVIGILAAIRAGGTYDQSWMSWVNVVLGVWVVVSPWMLAVSPAETLVINNVATGVIIAILAAWSALAIQTARA